MMKLVRYSDDTVTLEYHDCNDLPAERPPAGTPAASSRCSSGAASVLPATSVQPNGESGVSPSSERTAGSAKPPTTSAPETPTAAATGGATRRSLVPLTSVCA